MGETVAVSMPRGSSASCSLDTHPGVRYVIHGGGKAGQYFTSLCNGLTVRVVAGRRYSVAGDVLLRLDPGTIQVGDIGRTNAVEIEADADRPPGVLRFVAPFDNCDAPEGPVSDR